ncbi:tetratricopeptide repeat protein [Ectobacillus antri]|jgi:tetratricopeptide (TPR) repeat protein|uniref:Tetratricopeptide repeat protein n=1 Tax=Ectobacillus antri TaxID=2486280 RepID=A0ABT6H5Y5_9BACI|nr:tetratricopeptide repeat protein [Ectobacillus antri]MDG4657027.1 tetratricopeptide repeat protein [Ectobacillus antri]MDG5754129.1 tetratricopeptide repeat protein [Ectobacillus antri]
MIQDLYTNGNSKFILNSYQPISQDSPRHISYWIEGNVSIEELKSDIIRSFPEKKIVFYTKLNRMERSLLKPFRDFLLEHKSSWMDWDWVKEYKYELQTLFPSSNDEDRPDIFSVSWGWSEVRLNREIHWGFRLVHFVSRIISKLAEIQPVSILIEDLQNSDRISIYCIHHLAYNLKVQNLTFILNVKGYYSLNYKLDNGKGITKLLNNLKAKIDPVIINGSDLVIQETKTYCASDDSLEDNVNTFIHSLKSSEVEYNEVLEKLHSSLHLFNLENVLLLGDIILNNLNRFTLEQQKRLSYEVWRHIGIAQVFMDDYNNAIQSFIKMKEYTESVGEKVKACHLIATIYGKRLNNIDGAKEYIQKGMNIAQNSDDFRTLYEKGWLYNYVAYVSYSLEKDFDKALNYVNQAVEFLKPFKNYTPDSKIMDEIGNPISAERLLGNLTANISYLYFYKGDYQQALEAWKSLEKDIVDAPEVFKKEYFYFEGNLFLHLGMYSQAEESLKKSYIICEKYNDIFHQEIVSRKLGYTHFLMGKYEVSMTYYKNSFQLKELSGKAITNKDYQSLVLCLLLSGDIKSANKKVEELKGFISQEFVDFYEDSKSLFNNANKFLEEGPVILLEPFPMMNL